MTAKSISAKIYQLRAHAITSSLFRPTNLSAAITRMGFVQADPIRSPARAQDLILRHRVTNYRSGDLERRYSKLDIEEDYLYAYGFMPRDNWQLLHPRSTRDLSASDHTVLKLAGDQLELHPRDLEPHLGKAREVNAWGGYSKASTRMLEDLHYDGLLRIARRQDGIKIYTLARKAEQSFEPDVRLRKLVLLIAGLLSPVPESSLRAAVAHLAHSAPTLPGRLSVVKELVREGALEQIEIEGVRYLYPAGSLTAMEPPPVVRFLAPFDPLVWDRKRFEHLWGWAYRFEAYTPPAKRRLGYYAMPLLWIDRVIGWANVSTKSGTFEIDIGFVDGKPKDRTFRAALDEEISKLKSFLGI